MRDVISLNKLGTMTTVVIRNKRILSDGRPHNIAGTMLECKGTQTRLFGIQYGKPHVQRHLRRSAVGFETADTRGGINCYGGCTVWPQNTALKWRCNRRKTFPDTFTKLSGNLDACPSEHWHLKTQRNYRWLFMRTAMTLVAEDENKMRYWVLLE
jgi:hypothetical protein